MFGVGFSELILILIVALIAVGPKRLPGVAKALGRGYSEFKNALDDVKKNVVNDVTSSFDGVKDLKNAVGGITKNVVKEATQPLEDTADAYRNIYVDNLLAEREAEARKKAGPPPDLDAEPASPEAPPVAPAEGAAVSPAEPADAAKPLPEPPEHER